MPTSDRKRRCRALIKERGQYRRCRNSAGKRTFFCHQHRHYWLISIIASITFCLTLLGAYSSYQSLWPDGYADPIRLQELAEELREKKAWGALRELLEKAESASGDASTVHFYRGVLILNTAHKTKDPMAHFRMVDKTSSLFKFAIKHRLNLANAIQSDDRFSSAFEKISGDVEASPIGTTPFGLVVQAHCCINSNGVFRRPCPISRLEALLNDFEAKWGHYISDSGNLRGTSRVGEYIEFDVEDLLGIIPAHFILHCVTAGTAASHSLDPQTFEKSVLEVRRALTWRSVANLDRLSVDYLDMERGATTRLGGYCGASQIESEMGSCLGASQEDRRCRDLELRIDIEPKNQ